MAVTTISISAESSAPVLIGHTELPSSFSPVINPADTREVVGWTALGTAKHADRAVRCAHDAFQSWSQLSPYERGQHLIAAAKKLDVDTDARASLLVREQGKVMWESRADVGRAGDMLRYYASLAEDIAREHVTDDSRGTFLTRRRPMGVTAIIVPWNAPVYLAFLAVAPSLMAGNTIVVKPSELAPLALTSTLSILASALPEGVVNVVPGDGAEVGGALSGHSLVRKVLFTGSTASGQAVMRAAANNLKNIGLELGGNDPAIVLETAQLSDKTIREIVKGVFTGTGQICFNIKRIYVQSTIYQDFLEKFTSAVDEIVVGNGLDPESTMGPLNNRSQFDKVNELVSATSANGGKVTTLGRKLDQSAWENGYYMLPSVATQVSEDAEIVTCEQFGPIVPIMQFDEEADVIRRANDSEFGLAASIWTEDIDHAFELARSIDAGTVFANVHRLGASDITMPFGGVKRSGIGRNHGITAVEGCMELQVIAHRNDHERLPGPDSC